MRTNKERLRSLAASIVSIIAIGSTGCSKPELSAEKFQQISAVTDLTLQLVESTSAARSPDEVRTDIHTLSGAVRTAVRRIEFHRNEVEIRDRLDAAAVADVFACYSASMDMLSTAEIMQGNLSKALLSGDEKRIIGRQQMLTNLSHRAVRCAMLATETLSMLKSVQAFDVVAALIGPVYANAIGSQVVHGLAFDSLLERHIAANAIIIDRLAPKCAQRSGAPVSPCISYQLAIQSMPKLQAAAPTRAALNENPVAVLTRITDSQIDLLDASSEDLPGSQQTFERIAETVKAAQGEIQQHSTAVRIDNRVDARVYVEMKACSDAHAVMMENVSTIIRRYDELQVPKEAADTARKSVFAVLTVDASHCAIMTTTHLDTVADLDAVDKLGMLVGELYAISFATEHLMGLVRDTLLKPQTDAYQTVVTRLAPRCDPSQRSALNALFAKGNDACASYLAAADALAKLSVRNDSARQSE